MAANLVGEWPIRSFITPSNFYNCGSKSHKTPKISKYRSGTNSYSLGKFPF